MSDFSINIPIDPSQAIAGVNELADVIEQRIAQLAEQGAVGADSTAAASGELDAFEAQMAAISGVLDSLHAALAGLVGEAASFGGAGATGGAELVASLNAGADAVERVRAGLAGLGAGAGVGEAGAALGTTASDAAALVNILRETAAGFGTLGADGVQGSEVAAGGVAAATATVETLGKAALLTTEQLARMAQSNAIGAGEGIAAIQAAGAAAGASALEGARVYQQVASTLGVAETRLLNEGVLRGGGTVPTGLTLRQLQSDITTDAQSQRITQNAAARENIRQQNATPESQTDQNAILADEAAARAADSAYLESTANLAAERNQESAAIAAQKAGDDLYLESTVVLATNQAALAANERAQLANSGRYLESTVALATNRAALEANEVAQLANNDRYLESTTILATNRNVLAANEAAQKANDDRYLESTAVLATNRNALAANVAAQKVNDDRYIESTAVLATNQAALAANQAEALANNTAYIESTSTLAVNRQLTLAAEKEALAGSQAYIDATARSTVAGEQLAAAQLEEANRLRAAAGLPLAGVGSPVVAGPAGAAVVAATARNTEAAAAADSLAASDQYVASTVAVAVARNRQAVVETEALAADDEYIASAREAAAARRTLARTEGGGGGGILGSILPGGVGQLGQFAAFTAVFQGGFTLFNDIRTGIKDAEALTRQLGVLKTQADAIGQGNGFASLRDNVISVAKETGVAGSQVATLASEFLGLYQNVGRANEATQAAAELIKVIGANAVQAAPELGAIAEDLGASVTQIGNTVLDLQAKTGRSGQDLLAALGQISPAAADIGLTLNQTAGLLDVVATGSSRTGQALGELLARTLPQLTKDIPKILSDGIKLDPTALSGGAGSGAAILTDLFQQFGTLLPALQQKLVSDLGGPRQSPIIAALLNNPQAFAQFNSDFGTNNLLAKEFAASQNNLATTVDRAKASLVALGDALLHSGIVDFFQTGLEVVTPFLTLLDDTVNVAGKVNNALGDIPGVLLGVYAAFKLLDGLSLSSLGGAATGVLNKIPGVNIGGGAATAAEAATAGATLSAGAETAAATLIAGAETAAATLAGAATTSAVTEQAAATQVAIEFLAGAEAAAAALAAGGAVGGIGVAAGASEGIAGMVAGLNAAAVAGGTVGTAFVGLGGVLASLPPALLAIAAAALIVKANASLNKELTGAQNAADKTELNKPTAQSEADARRLFPGLSDQQIAETQNSSAPHVSILDRLSLGQFGEGGASDKAAQAAAVIDRNAVAFTIRARPEAQLQSDTQTLQAAGLLGGPQDQNTIAAALNNPNDAAAYQAFLALINTAKGTPAGQQALAAAAVKQQVATAVLAATGNEASSLQDAQDAFNIGAISLQQLLDAAKANVDQYAAADFAAQRATALKAQSQIIVQAANDQRKAQEGVLALNGASKTQVDQFDISSVLTEVKNPGITPQDKSVLADQIITDEKNILQDMANQATDAADAAKILAAGISLSGTQGTQIRNLLLQTEVSNTPGLTDALQQSATLTGTTVDNIFTDALTTLKSVNQIAIDADQAAINGLENLLNQLDVNGGAGKAEQIIGQKIAALQANVNALTATPAPQTPGTTFHIDPNSGGSGTSATAQLKSQDAANAAANALQDARSGSDAVSKAQNDLARANADLAAAVGNTTLTDQALKEQVDAGYEAAKALADLYNAQHDLVAAQLTASGDTVGADQQKLDEARNALKNAAGQGIKPGTAQYIALQKNVVDAQATLAKASVDAYNSQQDIIIAQLTAVGDSVGVAKEKLAEAKNALAQNVAAGGHPGDTEYNKLYANVIDAQTNVANATVAKGEQQIQDQLDLQQITVGQAVSELTALEAVTKDQGTLDQIRIKIKSLLSNTSNLQFDLPTDINLPTLYEARRLNETPAGSTYGGGQVDNRQQNFYFNVTGATLKQVQDVVGAAAGSGSASYGATPRRY